MDPSSFESSHVHTVYNEIASDFSRTRHSRWPFVETFLNKLPRNSLVLDAGTGNGKYLGVRSLVEWEGKNDVDESERKGKGKSSREEQVENGKKNDLFNVGFDMSSGLLGIASSKGHEVVRGDCVDMSCWRRGAFDHAISIATIHHFATSERRTESIKQMILSILPSSPPSASSSSPSRNPGQLLIVVWSLEQDPSLLGARSARRTTGGKKGAIDVSLDSLLLAQQRSDQGREGVTGEEGEGEDGKGKGKDVFVPWEKQEVVLPRKKKEPTPRRKRVYDENGKEIKPIAMVDKVEKVEEEEVSKLSIEESTAPKDGPTTRVEEPSTTRGTDETPTTKPTFNRYYHLFARYELSSLVESAASSLSLDFDCPADYPLNQSRRAKEAEREGEGGWRGYVELKEERWERENWVVEVEVGWRMIR